MLGCKSNAINERKNRDPEEKIEYLDVRERERERERDEESGNRIIHNDVNFTNCILCIYVVKNEYILVLFLFLKTVSEGGC
jgi:hypothetical protein